MKKHGDIFIFKEENTIPAYFKTLKDEFGRVYMINKLDDDNDSVWCSCDICSFSRKYCPCIKDDGNVNRIICEHEASKIYFTEITDEL